MIPIPALLFYMFSTFLLTSGVLVVTSRNTVYGVFFLILAFFNAAGLFILAHAEFLAMMLIVVYVGAVAVLFLFVVMMLNVEISPFHTFTRRYALIGGLTGGVLTIEIIMLIMNWPPVPAALDLTSARFSLYGNMTNTQALGNLLYTHYALIFQGVGIILLIAMTGAIVLTLRHREGVRKQNIRDQHKRQANESVRLMDISSGSGI
jgi:NADH-quinone oxidoreductase subunit J